MGDQSANSLQNSLQDVRCASGMGGGEVCRGNNVEVVEIPWHHSKLSQDPNNILRSYWVSPNPGNDRRTGLVEAEKSS